MLNTILLGLLVGIAVTTIANICTTVYLHRGLAHRAVRFSPAAHVMFRIPLWLSTGIKVHEWVAVHRKHHAHTDTELDPHSPAVSGWWTVQKRNLTMYRTAAHDPDNVAKFAKDLPRTWYDRYFLDQPWLGLVLGVAILWVTFGWQVAAIASFVHVNYYLGASAAVNAIGHHFGRRPYDNSATNLHWLALVTAGEGYHNNHHAAPTSARFAHRRDQIFDLGWMVIKPLSWLRLVRPRHGGRIVLAPDQQPVPQAA